MTFNGILQATWGCSCGEQNDTTMVFKKKHKLGYRALIRTIVVYLQLELLFQVYLLLVPLHSLA